jgi:hypothetical protein
MTRTLTILSFAVLTACGATNPGGGTGTLHVIARITSDGSTPGTSARVTIRDGSPNGGFVTNAEVVLKGGKLGKRTLTYDATRSRYELDDFAWDDALRLEVVRDRDFLDGQIEAPGFTVITSPIADTTFRKADGQPLIIKWTDSLNRRVQRVQVRVDKAGLDTTVAQDGLEFRVEPNQLKVEDKEKVRVERTNEVELAGGVAGSVLSASTNHSIEFRVE